jgi:hypothetical protein
MVVMGGLKPHETVLIHSAGGGVGIAATQIAKHIGAMVIGTASAAKHDELRALGVDHLIGYRTETLKRGRDRSPADGESNSSSTPSAGIRSRSSTGCLRVPAGWVSSARRQQRRARQAGSLVWFLCSPARPGFSSIPCL